MIATPKTYYAYSRSCMEKIDSCIAFNRIGAARIFAEKKRISLKDWLKIYSTYPYKECNKLYGKNIYFKKDGVVVMQYKFLKFEMPVVQRFNMTLINCTKVMSRNNFLSFMKFMQGCGYTVQIEL